MNDDQPVTGMRALRRVARASSARREIAELRQRVTELENEVQESRRLNRRVGELLDIVQELLVPVALRDEERIKRYLDAHAEDL